MPLCPKREPLGDPKIQANERSAAKSSSCSSSDSSLDQFHFIETSHAMQVLTGLRDLREDKQFCDITIKCESQEFLCHKLVLSSFSPYFKAMFSTDMAESNQEKVSINDVEPDMIRLLIDFAYTSEVLITKSNVQSLLSAANLLEVLSVRDACCHFMEKNMDMCNCVGIHCFAEAHACPELQQTSKMFLLQHFADVCQQEEFLSLSHSKLIEFISNDDLVLPSEEVVFNAVIRWLNHDVNKRSENFHLILEHVRLALLTPYFLHDVVGRQTVISDCEKCRILLEEAKTYHLLQDRRSELRTSRSKPRKASGMVEVIIAVGGEDDKVVLRSVESYDVSSGQWRTLACLPFAVSKHGLVVNGSNHMFMAGGEFPDGSASKSMWRYDPCIDKWQETSPMNMPRSELGLAMLDGFVYAVGGWEGSARLDSVERYCQLTNSWSYIPPMKIGITSPAVVSHDGMLYVTGGAVLEDGDGIDLVQCFNPRTNVWTELASMRIARSGSAACILDGSIYVIGGWHASTENTNKVERFDTRSGTWQMCAAMHERRYRPGVAVVDGKIYVCGGEEGWDRYHDTIECYDVSSDEWTIVGEMPSSRSWLSCVAMMIRRDLAFKGDKVTPVCVV